MTSWFFNWKVLGFNGTGFSPKSSVYTSTKVILLATFVSSVDEAGTVIF